MSSVPTIRIPSGSTPNTTLISAEPESFFVRWFRDPLRQYPYLYCIETSVFQVLSDTGIALTIPPHADDGQPKGIIAYLRHLQTDLASRPDVYPSLQQSLAHYLEEEG